ncbi:phosphoribosylanthranilate isomerase [Methylomusa anaerophila]|uniref:phosphoribosylanthranilate isomerase n=1 Tax=Methylomusa anaerophila TaxID=1930071 RepID=UPI0022B29952|nr:phosphoribosylanthranilate isomerase [Methylomusa anaerophila]
MCGVSSLATAVTAKECGADYIGFVFAPSRRRIAIPDACNIAREVKGIGKVGVFVNAPIYELLEIARQCRLDYVQLHGDESPAYCQKVNIPFIKAVRVNNELTAAYLAQYQADYILLDSYVPGRQGGTGITFDWNKTKDLRRKVDTPIIVAGGLTVSNVAEAIGTLLPAGIDVSGGVETNGQKDDDKIKCFVAAARRAAQGGGHPC